MGKTLPAAIGLLLLLLFGSFFGLTGCEKIVEVEKTVYDTLTVHDTTEVPKGPAYVRFVSLLSDRVSAGVALYRGPTEGSAPFGLAGDQSRSEFIPIPARTALKLYAFYIQNGIKTKDSIILPPFEPTNLYTCSVFGIDDLENNTTTLVPRFAWDSLKLAPAPEGKAYLRLINGLADFPTPVNAVNLKIKEAASDPIFAEDVAFSQVANYIEVPVGNYQLYLTAPDESGSILNSVSVNVVQGGYYTAMVYGRKAAGTARLAVTVE